MSYGNHRMETPVDARGVLIATTFALLLWSVGCGSQPNVEDTPDAGSLPNVVIFLVDTLRADRLEPYGYSKPTSPNLRELARESTLFEQAYSPAPWTLPSVVSLMLSQLICEHRVVYDGQVIDPAAVPLAERLRERGYRTGSFFVNPYAGALSGLDRGFDTSELVKKQNTGRTVADWLDQPSTDRSTPFFLYLHNTEPHGAHRAKDDRLSELGSSVSKREKKTLEELAQGFRRLTRVDFVRGQPLGTTDNTTEQEAAIEALNERRETFSDLYDARVLEADHRIGSVTRELKARGLWDDTLFILLADHGEEFGEHGSWLHDQSVYQELVSVPLIVKWPGGENGGRRVAEPVTLLDVVPTILEFAGGTVEGSKIRGRSLTETLGHSASTPRVTAMRKNEKKYTRSIKEARGDLNFVAVEGTWKGIFNPETDSFELYDLANDPDESKDLGDREKNVARRLLQVARDQLDQCKLLESLGQAPIGDIDPEAAAALKSLGYLSSDESSSR